MDRCLDLCYERRRYEHRRCVHQSAKTTFTSQWGNGLLARGCEVDAGSYLFHHAQHAGADEIPNALPLGIHLGGHVRDAYRQSQKEGFAQ